MKRSPKSNLPKIFSPEPIAVVGLGCIFPDANKIDEFWQNIISGKNSIKEVPINRWDPELYYNSDRSVPDKTYSKIGAFIEDFKFNSMEFRIPPMVVESIDIVQQMALYAAKEALEDAKYQSNGFPKENCAVIIGNSLGGELSTQFNFRVLFPKAIQALKSTNKFQNLSKKDQDNILSEFEDKYKKDLVAITEDSMPGELSNVISGRIAAVFNLRGMNITSDAACASALAAIDIAIKGLQFHEYDAAVVGGADRNMDPTTFVKFSKIGALSSDGSFPFDKRANGFVMGEGSGMFILKRLPDAIKSSDKIYALIIGVGSSSDGKGKGITAPNPIGQELSIRRAYKEAGISPKDIQLVEAHGTSTSVGDLVEFTSIDKVFKEHGVSPQSIKIGSIKSQIGHLKSAAGAAAIIKTTLGIYHKTFPPSINFEIPNPKIDWETSPFIVNTTPCGWKTNGEERRAGISSFGFGGTNFHVIMEEYNPNKKFHIQEIKSTKPEERTGLSWRDYAKRNKELESEAILVSARSKNELLAKVDDLLNRIPTETVINSIENKSLLDVVNKLNFNAGHKYKAGLSIPKLTEINKFVILTKGAIKDTGKRGIARARGIYVSDGLPKGKIVFLFPGQGSQYADMLWDLSKKYKIIQDTFEEADSILEDFLGTSLSGYIFANGKDRKSVENELRQTQITQPAMLTVDIALFRLLNELGIKPDIVAGHSLGEYAALVVSNCISFPDALKAVAIRGKAMSEVKAQDKGTMASISGTISEVENILQKVDGYVIAANKNSLSQTVISGQTKAVELAINAFEERGMSTVRLSVSAAFHTKIVAPAAKSLSEFLDKIKFKHPKIPVSSNVMGDFFPKDPEKIRELVKQQVEAPVEWTNQINSIKNAGGSIFFEVGPKRALSGFVGDILGDRDVLTVACNHPKKGGIQSLNEAISAAGCLGIEINQLKANDNKLTDEFKWPQPNAPVEIEDEIITDQTDTKEISKDQYSEFIDKTIQFMNSDAGLVHKYGLNLDKIVITGIGVGLPGKHKEVFDENNFERILSGENMIDNLDPIKLDQQLDKNIRRLIKKSDGSAEFHTPSSYKEVINLAGQAGKFDLIDEFKVSEEFAHTFDISTSLAIGAGFQALKDAGIPLVREYKKTTTGSYLPGDWVLPRELQDSTGVIFASVFPGYDSFATEISKFNKKKFHDKSRKLITELFDDINKRITSVKEKKFLLNKLEKELLELDKSEEEYHFNRKILLNVLSMGHSQFAQLIKARGPNTQTNAACASTTQALGIAEDWLRTGRCERVIIISADNITSENLFEWLGSGFLASGAATIKKDVTEAALPFDRRREGMIIGMGAAALIVEVESEARRRGVEPIVELLGSYYSNSSFHGTRLDVDHVSSELKKFMHKIHKAHGLTPEELGTSMVFMSHETYTPRRGGSASAEIRSLRDNFGKYANRIYIANTKGYTGHAMGAGIEDVVAIKSLEMGKIPPIANFKEPDPDLGNLKLSKGEKINAIYALRLAAGFGSQVAFTLYKKRSSGNRFGSEYNKWLKSIGGSKSELFKIGKILRLRDKGIPGKVSKITQEKSITTVAKKPIKMTIAQMAKSAILAKSQEDLVNNIISVISDKTGYPIDLLDPDLDMEADLGIDTVKQVEIFGVIREEYSIEREEGLSIANYPTINSVASYFQNKMGIVDESTQSTEIVDTISQKSLDLDKNEILDHIINIVSEKTGYPADMLDTDLDMEADLGIDTVKQAELFGMVREEYDLPRRDNLQISDYPTLSHVVDFVLSSKVDEVPEMKTISEVKIEEKAKVKTEVKKASDDIDEEIKNKVYDIISTHSGYPKSMLNDYVSIDDDLGLDGTTKNQIFDQICNHFDYPSKNDFENTTTIAELLEKIVEKSLPSKSLDTKKKKRTPKKEEIKTPVTHRKEILEQMIEIISQKTGYPSEMLEPDLDLEADLGIDTVKQTELFGIARTNFSIPRIEGMMISEYNTINKITDLIIENLDTVGETEDIDSQDDVIDKDVITKTFRYVLKSNHVEISQKFTDQGYIIARKHKAITQLAMKYNLEIKPSITNLEISDNSVLLLINPTKSQVKSMTTLFSFVKANLQKISKLMLAVKAPMKSLGRISEMSPLQGAIGGMFKALSMEFPDIETKIIIFEKYDQLDKELGNPGLEIIYHNGQRNEVSLQEEDLTSSQWKLPDNSVLIATGGAQGITFEIVKEIASPNSSLILLGRTQIREDAEEISQLSESDLDNRKWKLMDDLKATGEKVTPVTLEIKWSEIIKSANAWTAIKELQEIGCEVIYNSIDVREPRAMKLSLTKIKENLKNPITHVIHGAGLEISRSTRSKKVDEFQLVFDVKTKGFENLINNIELESVQRIIAFGSIAGRFGNATQVDYSAANEFLAKMCGQLAQEGIPATCIDWSVWADVGMGTRGSTMQILESQGVSAIPLKEGVRRFIEEVSHGKEAEVVISGNLGNLAAKVVWFEEKNHPDIMIDQFDITTNTAYRTLSLDKDHYLDDHRIDGKAVFPGAMGIETMAQVARNITGYRVSSMFNIRFISPVKLPRDNHLEIIVESEKINSKIKLILKSKFLGPHGKQLGALRKHFMGIVNTGDKNIGYPVISKSELNKLGNKLIFSASQIYNIFFHGPSYQVLDYIAKISETSIITKFIRPEKKMFEGDIILEIDPLMIEAAFQTAGAHLLFIEKTMGLPAAVGNITWFNTESSPCWIKAQLLNSNENFAFYDIEITDGGGLCLVRMTQIELIKTYPIDAPSIQMSRNTKFSSARFMAGKINPEIQSIEITHLKTVDESFIDNFLSKPEQSIFNSIKIKKKRSEWLAGRIAAKLAISRYKQIDLRGITIEKDDNRSPFAIVSDDKIDVSISHSNGLAVAIAGDFGLDIDYITKRDPSFVDEAFSSKEIREFKLNNAYPETITRLWTMKEAHLKRMRIGLKTDLHKVIISKVDAEKHLVQSKHGTSLVSNLGDKNWSISLAYSDK